MKKELKTIPYEIVKPPFFKKGVLRFASSEHYLRVSDRNYRCDLDCRGECGKKEPQIKKENMERNFCRYAVKFGLENNINNNLFIANLYKSVLHKIIDEEDWGTMVVQGDILDNTIDM